MNAEVKNAIAVLKAEIAKQDHSYTAVELSEVVMAYLEHEFEIDERRDNTTKTQQSKQDSCMADIEIHMFSISAYGDDALIAKLIEVRRDKANIEKLLADYKWESTVAFKAHLGDYERWIKMLETKLRSHSTKF